MEEGDLIKKDCENLVVNKPEEQQSVSEPDKTLANSQDLKTYATPEMVMSWKKQFLREGHSIPSTNAYYSFIKRYVDYGINIDQKSVNKFRNHYMSAVCTGALKNFFQFLVSKQEFPQEILYIRFDRSKSHQRFPKSIPQIEVERIIEAIDSFKDKLLTKTLYLLGLRISEALKLKWFDFSWSVWLQDKTQQGSVTLEYTKGGKFRVIPVPAELMSELYSSHDNKTSAGIPIGNIIFDYGAMTYLNNKDRSLKQNFFDYINYCEKRYRIMLNKVSEAVINKKISPHQLRHSRAQFLHDNGFSLTSIKSFLGHARVSSTEIYVQASPERLKKDFEAFKIRKDLEDYNRSKLNGR